MPTQLEDLDRQVRLLRFGLSTLTQTVIDGTGPNNIPPPPVGGPLLPNFGDGDFGSGEFGGDAGGTSTALVTSVAGRIGAVTLAQTDIAGLTESSSPTFVAVVLGGACAVYAGSGAPTSSGGAGATGDLYLREQGGVYQYDGASWTQIRRHNANRAYTPAGNEDTGTNATWPAGLTTSVTVPVWATRARLFAKLGQVKAVTSLCNVDVELLLGTLVADQIRVRWDNMLVGSGSERDLTLVGDVACASIAGSTVTLRTLGNAVSGSGVLRVDSESSCFVDVEFR